MELSITEKFLLLAQHPEKGKFLISGLHIQYGIIGALLLEMSIKNRIDMDGQFLKLKTSKTQKDLMISEIESKIRSAPKPRKINRWINSLARKSKKFKKTILDQLVSKKLIRIERRKFLGIIPYQTHYLLKRRTRQDIIQRLKADILSGKEISGEEIILLGLIEACKMQSILSSDKSELKNIKSRLKEVIKNSPIAESVGDTIEQVQAAIFVAIIASTAATSGSAH